MFFKAQMEIKIFVLCLIIFSSFHAIFAQNEILRCNYTMINLRYSCVLTAQNPNGLNNFLTIEGTHLAGKTDADVFYVVKQVGCNTAVIPSIICSKFPNLVDLDMNSCGIKRLEEASLKGCRKLSFFLALYNSITDVHEKTFFDNIALQHVSLSYNQITVLPENLFINQKILNALYFLGNKISDLPMNIFKPLIFLSYLTLAQNQISTLRPEWFAPLQKLTFLSLNSNLIENLPKNIFAPLNSLKTLMMESNKLKIINSDAFSIKPNLTNFYFFNNQINSIDRRLLDMVGVTAIDMRTNICANKTITDTTVTKDTMRAELKKCFDNYLICCKDPNLILKFNKL